MSRPLPGPTLTFWTKAPEDAPEVKGYTCYFKPERLEWRVRTFWQRKSRVVVDVVAHGPATRVEHREGAMRWGVEGSIEGDTRPAWLLLPLDQLASAILTIEELAKDVPS